MKKIMALVILILLPSMLLAHQEKYSCIYQKGKKIYLSEEYTQIELKRQAFTIRFYNSRYTDDRYYATRIAIFTDKTLLDKAQAGLKDSEVPYLAPYTGLAADSLGYSAIFLDGEAHHYLYYKDEQDRRVKLVSESQGVLELEWSPHSFYIDGQDKEFSEAGVDRMYMVIYSDRDLDGVIDQHELRKVAITFK
jgi:hypothetical protein